MSSFFGQITLDEKCPNTELFLVRIFPHPDWIWRDTVRMWVKYRPEIIPYLGTFHAMLNSWNIYSKLISFRIICFTLNSVGDKKKYCIIKITKKSSAKQMQQGRMINISKVQVNKLLFKSQRVMSCKPKSCELRVSRIARQRVMSLSHRELLDLLLDNKLASCKSASQWVSSPQVNHFQGCEPNQVNINVLFLRTCRFYSKSYILRFFMMLMSKILRISIFVPGVYSKVLLKQHFDY